jgi:hypothetical protein
MIQFILMLLGLAFSNNNANTAACTNNNQGQTTVQVPNSGSGVDPGGSEGDTSGGSGQKPPL